MLEEPRRREGEGGGDTGDEMDPTEEDEQTTGGALPDISPRKSSRATPVVDDATSVAMAIPQYKERQVEVSISLTNSYP